MTPFTVLSEAQALGILFTVNGEKLLIDAPAGVMTLELKRALKTHKADILYLFTLPEPARPGPELAQLRREIGELVRAEEAQWVLSDKLDLCWPKSAGVHQRLYRKETVLWESQVQV